jgi:anti-sigma28 factor (negative regulator of flagellin synthesis)
VFRDESGRAGTSLPCQPRAGEQAHRASAAVISAEQPEPRPCGTTRPKAADGGREARVQRVKRTIEAGEYVVDTHQVALALQARLRAQGASGLVEEARYPSES